MVKRLSSTNQNNTQLTNIPTPVNDTDAANKAYVDANTGPPEASEITGLATVATTGSYDDLSDKPAIQKITVSSTAPSSPAVNDLWVDIS